MSYADMSEFSPATVRLRKLVRELAEALEMVRDADEDCGKDRLLRMPEMARTRVNQAIAKAEAELGS